jgi:hypothetical protein
LLTGTSRLCRHSRNALYFADIRTLQVCAVTAITPRQ